MTPDYFTRYAQMHMQRDEDGILEIRFHTNGGECRFGPRTHQNFVDAFYDISRDPDTRVVIMTGTGDNWIAEFDESQATDATISPFRATGTGSIGKARRFCRICWTSTCR